MKNYIGIKSIEARPMNLGDYNTHRGWDIPEDEDPLREGYLVKYPDGYESWSPKEQFEEAYTVLEQSRLLETIQRRELLNIVTCIDNPGVGGGCHQYLINNSSKNLGIIQFQKGPRNDPNATSGVLDSDLLEIVRDRLSGFQDGPYASRENDVALVHIEEALMWMARRVEDRLERQVLGYYKE